MLLHRAAGSWSIGEPGGRLAALGAAIAAFATAGAARAQVDLLSPATIHGVVDLRTAASDGEPSFYDGGFGKARYGGDGTSAFHGDLQVAFAALEWTPRLTWDLSAVVDVFAQPGQEHAVDLGQAYIVFKPVPRSATRFSAPRRVLLSADLAGTRCAVVERDQHHHALGHQQLDRRGGEGGGRRGQGQPRFR